MNLEEIQINNVKENFAELINAWCESNYKTYKVKPEMMCQIAVEKFGSSFSVNFIRKSIDDKFKVKYRQQNAKVGILKRLGNLEKTIQQNLYQTKVYEDK